MRTISPALEALLRNRFQAAGSGYAARLEVDEYVGAGVVTGPSANVNHDLGTLSDGGGTQAWSDLAYGNDGNLVTTAKVGSFVHGAGTYTAWLVSDLGTDCLVGEMTVPGSSLGLDPDWGISHSSDGVTWVPVTGRVSSWDGTPNFVATLTFDPVLARYWRLEWTETFGGLGYWGGLEVADWVVTGEPQSFVAAHYLTSTYAPKRVNLNRNLRMGPDQATIELVNEDLALGFGPTSIFPTNSRCRAYQWFGDPADAVLTFTGVIDKVDDNRDPLMTTLTCRSMAGPILVDQTFSTTAPQGADESGAVRTEDNGVYLAREVDYIVRDRLTRAGWPSLLIDVADTTFVLDEFLVEDGATEWDTLARLAAFVGYTQWDDEDGVYHFGTLGAQAAVDDTLAADYEYEIGAA